MEDPVEKVEFSTGSASRNSQSRKVESKKPFFDCVRKPDLGFSRKRPFSTDKSDCKRNGLSIIFFGGIWSGVFFVSAPVWDYWNWYFSVKSLLSSAVFGERLQRPSPCLIRSAPRRERG